MKLLLIFIMLLIHPLAMADLNSDTQALLDFASAVPHLRRLNWNSGTPICTSWVGISCNSEKTRVTAVHLPGVGLYGPIPVNSIGKLTALRVLSLRSNLLTGNLPPDVLSIPSLQSLFLQHNNLSGEISLSSSISPQLGVIDLSFNSFSGEIPAAFKGLNRLSMLNLQFNSFTGAIPDLNLPRLKLLNLSHNNLNGTIPKSLQKFPTSSFAGNSLSSISPSPSPSLSPADDLPKQKTGHSKKLSPGAITAIVVGASSILFLLSIILIFRCLERSKKDNQNPDSKHKPPTDGKPEKSSDFGSGIQGSEKNKLVFFDGCSYSFDLEDLLRASAEVLGKGSNGTAYKVIMDEGTTVVVKRLREVGVAKKEFEQHMEVVGKVGKHPNIVPLRAFYFSKDEKLLVYEYMPMSSLSARLHGNRGIGRTPLDWDTRLKISLGAARGLSHLHTEGGAKFIHGNIKSSNILLTADLDGRISDVGLTPITNFSSTKSRGSTGYRAPEVTEPRKITQKSDVYSFGVVLLEILTGKAPQHPSGHQSDCVDLPRWVRSVVREEWTAEVFDSELVGSANSVEEEMVQLLQIGLSCVARAPEVRPSMEDVVKLIEEMRTNEFDNRPSSEDRSKDSNVHSP